MSGSTSIVVTTIQPPTESVRRLQQACFDNDARLLVVGDQKGPQHYDLDGVEFFSLEDQHEYDFNLLKHLPVNHYARKNFGYLHAMHSGAPLIYETDDDNYPLANWRFRLQRSNARIIHQPGWYNVYRAFCDHTIWPRGFPLDEIRVEREDYQSSGQSESVASPVQQGLADNSPDVDAIWRLTLDQPIEFHKAESIHLSAGVWCPFNSQSTWWWPEAYALLYLPSFCTMRMTDIWRGLITQRCLWAAGTGVSFHAPEVVQERNPHNLMRDFNDEIPGYRLNRQITEVLTGLDLRPGLAAIAENLRRCYIALVEQAIFPEQELELLDAWLSDLPARYQPAKKA